MSIAVIDCGSGNLHSVARALAVCARAPGAVEVTRAPDRIAGAERIVLPGVGAFQACREGLAALPGVEAALQKAVCEEGRPFLGICVGMHLMAGWGREHGRRAGLGWIAGEVRALTPSDPACRLPHMGWNQVRAAAALPALFETLAGRDVYFAHSFHFVPEDRSVIGLTCDHGGDFAAAVRRGAMAGVQFHPEKSQKAGLDFLRAFLEWEPEAQTG